jgi:hypothetical protein
MEFLGNNKETETMEILDLKNEKEFNIYESYQHS